MAKAGNGVCEAKCKMIKGTFIFVVVGRLYVEKVWGYQEGWK